MVWYFDFFRHLLLTFRNFRLFSCVQTYFEAWGTLQKTGGGGMTCPTLQKDKLIHFLAHFRSFPPLFLRFHAFFTLLHAHRNHRNTREHWRGCAGMSNLPGRYVNSMFGPFLLIFPFSFVISRVWKCLEVQWTQENIWGLDRHDQPSILVCYCRFLIIFCLFFESFRVFMHFSRIRIHWDATGKQGDLGRVGRHLQPSMVCHFYFLVIFYLIFVVFRWFNVFFIRFDACGSSRGAGETVGYMKGIDFLSFYLF